VPDPALFATPRPDPAVLVEILTVHPCASEESGCPTREPPPRSSNVTAAPLLLLSRMSVRNFKKQLEEQSKKAALEAEQHKDRVEKLRTRTQKFFTQAPDTSVDPVGTASFPSSAALLDLWLTRTQCASVRFSTPSIRKAMALLTTRSSGSSAARWAGKSLWSRPLLV
jgi:hypothetical protein